MKVLFCGLGSIGQRHLNNLKELTVNDDLEIFAYRSSGQNCLIIDCKKHDCRSLAKHYGIKEYNDLNMAFDEKLDVVFICNPNSKHMEIALRAVEAKCDLFIEKPLSNSMDDIEFLKTGIENNNLISMIAYQMRFHPCVIKIKSWLNAKKLGNVISASLEWGTYLPRLHPYEDYRIGYAAKNSLGGGAVLSLIHELDLVYHFFGKPLSIYAVGGKISSLEIDVEDTISAIMTFDKENNFHVNVNLSFAQTVDSRSIRIQLDKGTILCNLIKNELRVFDENAREIDCSSYENFCRNDLFIEEMKEFLSSVKKRRKTTIPIEDGIASLSMALKIKECINNNKPWMST